MGNCSSSKPQCYQGVYKPTIDNHTDTPVSSRSPETLSKQQQGNGILSLFISSKSTKYYNNTNDDLRYQFPFPPNIGLTIKSLDLVSKRKIFVNIFHHFSIVEDLMYVSGLLGTVLDKKGEEAIAVNVMLSIEAFQKLEEDILQNENRVVSLLFQLINEKFSFQQLVIDKNTVKFPHIKRGFISEGNNDNTDNLPLFYDVDEVHFNILQQLVLIDLHNLSQEKDSMKASE